MMLKSEAQSSEARFDFSRSREISQARNVGFLDLVEGVKAWRLWTLLAWTDILQRYRRSALGPFWITASMSIFIVLLGVIYSRIFKMDIAVYLPYVAAGLIVWGFISGTTSECCSAFIDSAGVIKQLRLPFTTHILRVIWRSMIILFHTIILMVPISIFFRITPTLATLFFIPGLLLVFINQIWIGLVVSILSTRYRDVAQIIATAIQIAMFATPIMWPAESLQGARIIADVNPLYHLLEVVRAPLLGKFPEPLSWLVVISVCLFGYALAIALLQRSSRRIVYWL